MSKQTIDNVEIVEPPIEELTKKRSGFKKTCLTGCLTFIVFIIIFIVVIKIAVGPGPKTIKELPVNFPIDIPIYDRDNIENYTFISGRYKSRGTEIASFFPKIILSPLYYNLNHGPAEGVKQISPVGSIKKFFTTLTTPIGDARDTVQIEWLDVRADHIFFLNYYRNELKKRGFTVADDANGRQISFERTKDNVSGTLFVKTDSEEKRAGTEYAILTVNMPSVGK